jgi:phage/plasmid primase-like uncharacterized protein
MARCHIFDKATELTLFARTVEGKAELEALQAQRVEEEAQRAAEKAAEEAEEAARIAAKLERKQNNILTKIGLTHRLSAEELEAKKFEAEIEEESEEEPSEEV